MENNFNDILVFATNIKTESDKQIISIALNKNTAIQQWNIDQEDIDCVLTIISNTLSTKQIIELINNHNFDCSELE